MRSFISRFPFAFPLLCMAVHCGRPDVDHNGVVYGNDWWVGSVVRYTCRSGFMLVGNPTRSCQPNGLWTPKPMCLREWPQWCKASVILYEPFQLITGFLSSCLLGMCRRGQIEISERELNGTCNSTCTYKSYFGPPKQGCTQIDNCRKKETGWKRFFAQCVPCICDCALSCSQSVSRHTVMHKWRNYWTDVMWAFCGAISAQILGIWLFKYCFKHEFVFFCFFSASAVWTIWNTVSTVHWDIR